MALNFFPRRRDPLTGAPLPQDDEPETAPGAPQQPTPDAEGSTGESTRRRGNRGGRSRRRPETAAGAAPTETPDAPPADEGAAAEPRPRRRRARPEPAPASAESGSADLAGVVRALEEQREQIAQLVRSIDSRGVSPSAPAAAPLRVGVFVDAANVELARERQRNTVDWGKVLMQLTENRRLVRAIVYSPVYDDPAVSMDSQRFVEPFLDRGYRIVTKPLKRFQDGTIKANIDIELALDIIQMIDRLDVVCLVSGDGDFERLVEVAQERGVRVEVASFGSSTASSLRKAADAFIDLGKVR